ncbi:MAG TPA: TlpA disulfide reductase family protein [Candidatus Acidoferrales bacterium]|nr:TlpA disulfide reductase family protein [Candidatus Acidoferrales bacterium]
MKKSLLLVLAAVAALMVLVAALTTPRLGHVAAATRLAPAHNAPLAPKNPQDDASDDDPPAVIRFASNPAPMPPFLVSDLDDNVISTASWRGKVVLLNFWATWCPPCREEIPELIELEGRYKDRLQVIGISEDDAPPEEVRAFAREMGINYPIVMGSNELAAEYGDVPALPTSFVVNPDGRIVQKHVGLFPIEVYDREIRALLGMPVTVPIETFEDTGQIFLKNAALATTLPGVEFRGLTQKQKRAALKRMNSENCTCGCKFTIAQCRINDPTCSTSQKLATEIVHEIRSGGPASPSAATAAR